MKLLDAAAKDDVQRVIDANHRALQAIPGFVHAEPGFPLVDGRILTEPAIIAFVAGQAHDAGTDGVRPPASLGPYSVFVMQASPRMQLSMLPGFAPGPTLDGPESRAQTYVPIDGNPIDQRFDVRWPMLCHISPDAGWPTLEKFLKATRETLTIAMYDFNATYIAKVFTEAVLQHGLTVVMTWDNVMKDGEKELLANLRQELDTRFDCWEVRHGNGRRFDSAYHPKVAVRDSSSFWLSSGNWSKNSQPEIDPVKKCDQRRGMFTKRNRDWHIVVDDEPLARLFEQYITYDRDESKREADEAIPSFTELIDEQHLPDLFVSLDAFADADALQDVPEPIPPERLPSTPRVVSVQPVLTPDNYHPRLMELLRAAKHSIDIQFAYIRYNEQDGELPENAGFVELLELLRELSHQSTKTLRIIQSGDADDLCRLVAFGVDQSVIKTQSTVHNKGIIVDQEIVLVSSANWSFDGVLRNRDAGLIIYDEEIASYYQRAFDYDWNHRASGYIQPDPDVRIAPDDAAPPEGMVRIAWHDYYDD
ncbi:MULTISPECIES: phospholipase D-like domain-containing protein [unclassified Mycobacterium]|uniref:phospholipase D-like domain-containing protein n=1 Tax=unclassified Mycobacterium TaxID=2642494 RepID=UPI0029C6AFD9|nr:MULTISPECIES: phospholipase D-like domain-containing protein [unclassified Mycobacterium]